MQASLHHCVMALKTIYGWQDLKLRKFWGLGFFLGNCDIQI